LVTGALHCVQIVPMRQSPWLVSTQPQRACPRAWLARHFRRAFDKPICDGPF
jgi:hypothetical protein